MQEINQIEAGRELDALVASKVMSLDINRGHYETAETSSGDPLCIACGTVGDWSDDLFGDKPCIPHYSTDIAAAWQVVGKLTNPRISWEAGTWLASCDVRNEPPYEGWRIVSARADGRDAAPLAICRAALAAIEPL